METKYLSERGITLTVSGYDPNAPRIQLCSDCPPIGYPTDKTRCVECPRTLSSDKKVPHA